MEPIGKVVINGHTYEVWSGYRDNYSLTTGCVGHVCESAQEIGWKGETAKLPDYKGGWFDAPILKDGEFEKL